MSAKNLVIVESPAKAKTIEKYLGSDFVVESSYGHIRDLPQKGLNIDKENNFKPAYEIPDDKKEIVRKLKKALGKDSIVWLASDEDREGEAIAWHLCQALGLDPKTTNRIVFHEITKPAIEQAIKNPRKVNEDLVNSQQARRVLDRLVGYELSPVLWKKVQRGLSAGRVQSVAVRLILEREREIEAFQSKSSYKISAEFLASPENLKAILPKNITDKPDAETFLKDSSGSKFSVENINKKSGTRNPSPPFTTSSLQQEASSKLGFSVRQTMSLAQRLYESGKITYMRTDSTTLSSYAITEAEKIIKSKFGEKYAQSRQYKTKSRTAQEAHESIRPTNFKVEIAGADEQQKKLYQLIWKRTLASQMSSAQIEKTEIDIIVSKRKEKLVAKGEILAFDGYLKVYGGNKDDVILPDMKIGSELSLISMQALQTYERPPARYSEASLVKKLEELGIGRPSTYAPTIHTIQARNYVEKSDSEGRDRELDLIILKDSEITQSKTTEKTGVERAKLLPTYLAEITTDFLTKHFASIVDYDFTAKVEKGFDEVARGEEDWSDMIKNFYKGLEPLIKQSENVSRQETSKARLLGTDPKTKKPIYARFGRFGPMLQKGETESEEKPAFAPLPTDKGINTVSLEEALEMFKLPKVVGKTKDGKEILANIGRFGPYIQIEKTFVSIKPLDPFTVDEAKARELYENKKELDKNKYIKKFDSGISIINGPYGPYITDGKRNARLPKDQKPEELDEETCKQLLSKVPERRKKRRAKK
ncbi:MAG: type I DNA topoisomerase [Candidatus Saccharimonadales bacterium]